MEGRPDFTRNLINLMTWQNYNSAVINKQYKTAHLTSLFAAECLNSPDHILPPAGDILEL